MTRKASGPASALAMPRGLDLATALLLLLGTIIGQVHAIGSFQNGRMNGAAFAGAVDYSSNNVFITGITYGTNGDDHTPEAQCFVSRFESADIGTHPKTVSIAVGDGSKMQSCHSISVLHDPLRPGAGGIHPFVVAGTADPQAVVGLTDQPSGFVVSLKQEKDGEFPFKNQILTDGAGATGGVSYPISIRHVRGQDTDGSGDRFNESGDRITYVTSLTSNQVTINEGNIELMLGSKNQPNWMKYYKYGSSFDLTLQKFNMPDKSNDMELSWTKTYPAEVNAQTTVKPDVFVGGMILKRRAKKDFLIVAGSTSGAGEVYGDAQPGTTDEDGFIAVFNGHTGDLRNLPAGQPTFRSTSRPGTSETDLILGICDDPNDNSHFYIVGATGDPAGMGDQIRKNSAVLHSHPGSLHGFVQKIELNTLKKVWGKTWSANFGSSSDSKLSTTAGYGCKVIADGSLYVAGIVENGAHITRGIETKHDFDDIVAMRLTADGDVEWIKQFGSNDGNEELARSEPVAIDHDENMVILGDTTGSLFRKREDNTDNTSDVFVVTLAKENGGHDSTVHKGGWGNFDDKLSGMLSGGKWKDDEVYGTTKWVDMTALGIQSGPTSGSVYAGGMVYDSKEDTVYVSGIAYNSAEENNILSSCMVTRLTLGQNGFNGWGSATGKVIGQNGILEICDSIALHGYGEVVAIGSADKGSNLQSGNLYPMAGFALALDRFDLKEMALTTLVTKDPNQRIQYPIDIVSDGDDMYIVSLTSTDTQSTPEAQKLADDGGHSGFAPNWINMKKYGSSFDMTVSKVTLKETKVDGVSLGDISFTTQWTKEFPMVPDDSGNIPRVFLGGAILKKSDGYLAVSGSTRGMGDGYGAAKGDDEDGFVTLLDMKTGELAENVVRNNLREGTPEDDVVLGMCDDPDDSSSFYIVGGTKGKMPLSTATTEITKGSTHAFLLKVNAKSLSTMWTVQLGASRHKNDGDDSLPTTAKAFDCAVSGDTIYVGGIVDDNAGIVVNNKPRSSRGGDDIWVGSFSSEDGAINWVRQMGSDGNDHIAPRGGLVVNKKGDVLVFGDTNGDFYRNQGESDRKVNELFLMEVKKDGSHKPHVKHDKVTSWKMPPSAPAPAPSIPSSQQTTAPPFLINEPKEGLSTGLIIALSVGVSLVSIILMILAVYCCRKRYCGRRKTDAKYTVRDGIINTDKRKSFAKSPPPSSFQDHRVVDGNGDSENLNAAADII